jgi:alpha-galactosidase/6-phospho-beta-glucosidase family protein|tara:strand:- start:412 stop:867 length:456 start_codon:yes stop_codon:yes gene_type:complete
MTKPRKRQGEFVHASVWTPANKKAILEMFSKGASIVEACNFLGINKSTWYRWLKDDRKKDFQEVAELGLDASESYWVQLGRDNIENKSFNTALYSFLMVNKFNYRSAYSKQEKDIKEVKEHKIEVKKSVDIDSILSKLGQDVSDEIKEQIH